MRNTDNLGLPAYPLPGVGCSPIQQSVCVRSVGRMIISPQLQLPKFLGTTHFVLQHLLF